MTDDDLHAALDDLLVPLAPAGELSARTARRVQVRRRLKVGAGAAGGSGVLVLVGVLLLGGGTTESLLPPADAPTAGPSVTAPATPSPSSSPSASVVPSPPDAPATSSPSAAGGAPASPDVPADPSAEAVAVSLVLRPDGLGFTDGGSGTSALLFGSADTATVRAAVARALGEGTANELPDCAAGVSGVQHEGLSLLLRDGVLVGWSASGPGVRTGDGIGVGSTLADLRAAFGDVQVVQGSVGSEWSTAGDGGLAGFLDGPDEASTVTGVTAGYRCVFR